MKKIFISSAIILILFFFSLNYFFDDAQINKYPNLQDVKNDTAIQRGIIPAIIPISAYDIKETHDLDTNTIVGSFHYKELDEEKFIENLTNLNGINNTLEWGNFLFKVNKKLNHVNFRNKPMPTQ